jgi:TRAP-type C4-dicarboxylate transport system substrate-binding protein
MFYRKSVAMAAIVAAAVAVGATSPAVAEIDTKEFKVVGTWHFLNNWKKHEKPLWTEILPKASGGKITANVRPLTELGLKGFELMRQLKVGVFDFAHGVTSYVASDAPAIEGVDLSGVVQDLPTYRKVMNAYRGILSREFDQRFNSKILMLYSFPSQQVWCNLKDRSITKLSFADLKGKKIRTYSTTLGDFIEGLGASAVTIAFSEVVPALQKGVADCGITGTMPAYNAKWWQVVTHNFRIRLGYASAFLAVNNKVWNGLSADTQKLMVAKFKEVEDAMWETTKEDDQMGMDCNASGPCPLGEPGGMVPIEASDADRAQLKQIVQDFVLKRWVKRCGQKCAQDWDATIGKIMGLKAAN